MKKKFLAALCAICTCAMSFTASFCPTASASYAGTYVTYSDLVSNSADNVFYGTEEIRFTIKATNTYGSNVYVRYKYTIENGAGNEVYTSSYSDNIRLVAGTTNASQTITLPALEEYGSYGSYTLKLRLESGLSLSNLDTYVASAQYTVCDPDAEEDYVTYGALTPVGTHTGNIFYGSEEIKFRISVTNNYSGKVYGQYTATITDENDVQVGGTITSDQASLQAGGSGYHEITIPVKGRKYGNYVLTVDTKSGPDLSDPQKFQTSKLATKFSVCIPLNSSNINEGFGFNQVIVNPRTGTVADAEALRPLMQNAGARWHREDVLWNGVENTATAIAQGASQYKDLATYKERLRRLRDDYGIHTVCILKGTHDSYDGGGTPYTTTGINGFAAFCGEVARQLDGVVDHYEIWNEWNISAFNDDPVLKGPDVYARLLMASYDAIKTVNSENQVIGCDTAGIPNGINGWIDTVLKTIRNEGDPNKNYYMDAISVHTYEYYGENDPNGHASGFPEQEINTKVNGLKDLLDNYGLRNNMQIWLTETGFSTYTGSGTSENPDGSDSAGCSEQEQLNALVMLNVANKAYGWFDNVFQYCFSNRGTDRSAIQENWGVVNNWGKDQIQGYGVIPKSCAKPAYLGLAAMNYFIGGNAEYLSKEEDIENRLYAFSFYNHNLNKKVTLVIAGGLNNSVQKRLNIGYKKIDVYDKYGNWKQSMTSSNGQYRVPISSEPAYIVSGPEFAITKDGTPVTSGNGLKAGDTLTIGLSGMDAYAGSPSVVAAQFNGDRFIKADSFDVNGDTFEENITIASKTNSIKFLYWDMVNIAALAEVYEIK